MVSPLPCGFFATALWLVSNKSGQWVKSIACAYFSPTLRSSAGARWSRSKSRNGLRPKQVPNGGNAYMVTALQC